MEIPERYRWVDGALAVTFVVLAAWSSVTLLSGMGGLAPGCRDAARIVAVLGVVLPIIPAALLLRHALHARRRYFARRAYLSGDTAAMPSANLPVEAAEAPDVRRVPLRLEWRWRPRTVVERVFGPVMPWTLTACAGIVPAAVSLSSAGGNGGACVIGGVTALPGAPIFAGLTSLAVTLAVLAWRVREPLHTQGTFGLVADDEGITARMPTGRVAHIPWGTVRLVEFARVVETPARHEHRHFYLYADGATVEWYERGPSERFAAPAEPGTDVAEMVRRSWALLNLIAARTGHVPRMCPRGGHPGDERARTAKYDRTHSQPATR